MENMFVKEESKRLKKLKLKNCFRPNFKIFVRKYKTESWKLKHLIEKANNDKYKKYLFNITNLTYRCWN